MMLSKANLELTQTPTSVKRLVKAWTQVYSPNFQRLAFTADPTLYTNLAEALSLEGRAKTAAKLSKPMLTLQCDLASIQTKAFYNYRQNGINPHEVRQLAAASYKIYTGLVDLYRQGLLGTVSVPVIGRSPTTLFLAAKLPAVDNISDIERLTSTLKPLLLEFQDQPTQSKNWRAFSLMTTQLNFCNQWIMDKLTLIEQFLLAPYLKFVEEQIAHPWYRMCAAAATHPTDSPILSLVETMIPLSEDIAQAAYQSLIHLLPDYHSHRGNLTNPSVAHSCIRDLKIFQAYLWLSVLEGGLAAVEQELLHFCAMVLPNMDVQWSLIERWTQVLADEIIRRVGPSQQAYVVPYTTGMHQLCINARPQLDPSYPYSLLAAVTPEHSKPELIGDVSR